MELFGQTHAKRELLARTGQVSQLFGVDLLTHSDGPERPNRVLRFRTAAGLDFDLMLDRAMDLAGLRYLGVPISWHSAPGFRTPFLHDTDDEDGYAFFRTASGLLTTCGLDHIHAPERDGSVFGHPPQETLFHPLHGRIPFTPARLTGYGTRWDGDDAVLFAEAEVRQASTFAEKLVLTRRVEVDANGTTFRMTDTIRNEGFTPTPHACLWHINMGFPLLDEGAEVVAPVRETVWRLRDDAPGELGHTQMLAPQRGTTQQVWDHRVTLEQDGTGRAALLNPGFRHPAGTGLALEIAYDGNAMPSLGQWHNFREGDYVMALEPSNLPIASRSDWREAGVFSTLDHGEDVTYTLALTPHIGADALCSTSRPHRRGLIRWPSSPAPPS